MIISASIIWKPRKKWTCHHCELTQNEGPVARVYGAAYSSELPYVIKLHPACINKLWADREPKIQEVLNSLEQRNSIEKEALGQQCGYNAQPKVND